MVLCSTSNPLLAMKTTSYLIILLLAMAMPAHLRSQQVLVNIGNAETDSVTVTVTVTMPKQSKTVTDSIHTLLSDSISATITTAPADSSQVIVASDSTMPAPIVTSSEQPISEPRHYQVVRKNTLGKDHPEVQELVIVRGDTVPMVIPTKNYGRFDRGLFNYLYIVRHSWQFGLSASYGEFSTDDVQVLSMLKNLDFKGKLYSIKPWVSFCFRNNQTMGLRLNYTKGKADLANLSVDIDDDMKFDLHDVSYYSQTYSLGVFYRNYVGLSRDKRFAVFNEVALEFSSGSSRFKRYYNDELSDTRTVRVGSSLNFSPGICVFIHENAAFNVSFGVFGLKFNKDKQTTNGVDEGTRFSSGANFRFNIFNINLGLMVVI